MYTAGADSDRYRLHDSLCIYDLEESASEVDFCT